MNPEIYYKYLEQIDEYKVPVDMLPTGMEKNDAFAKMILKAAMRDKKIPQHLIDEFPVHYYDEHCPYYERIKLPARKFYKGMLMKMIPATNSYCLQVERFNSNGKAVLAVTKDSPTLYVEDVCIVDLLERTACEPAIAKASGKVLTYGLGLGYFAYMAHLKPEVERVTIIEKDARLIKLFTNHILPQFDQPEKVLIVTEAVDENDFDLVFVNCWRDDVAGVLYYLIGLEAGKSSPKYLYRLEENIISRIESANQTDPYIFGEWVGDRIKKCSGKLSRESITVALADAPIV